MNKDTFSKIYIPIIAALAGAVAGALSTHVLESSSIEKAIVRTLSKYYDFIDISMGYEEALGKSYEEYEKVKAELADRISEAEQKENENNDLKKEYDILKQESEQLSKELNASKRTEDIITQAKKYADEGRFDLAISMIGSVDLNANHDAQVLEKDYIERFEQQTIENANRYVNSGDYDTADSIIAEALSAIPNSATLSDTREKIAKLQPQYLLDVLQPYERSGYEEFRGPSFTMGGEEYTNGFILSFHGKAYFNLNGNYKVISGIIGHTYSSSCENQAVFYIDGIPKYTIVVGKDELPKPFEINIEGANQLIIEYQSGGYGYGLGFAKLKIR